MPTARPQNDFLRVLELKGEGRTDCEVSALSGVPVNTIRTWRRGRLSRTARFALDRTKIRDVCGTAQDEFDDLQPAVYAYLLGVYLGDGCLSPNGRSWSLRIWLDAAYPGIIAEACEAVTALRGRTTNAHPRPREQCVVIASTWQSWICLLPQHGPGKKHRRRIELLPWQQALVDQAPGSLLRGLIHTDGWRGINAVVSKGKRYEYPRYQLSNRSDDIRRIFTDACDALGVEWRRWTRFHISVAKRESVALLNEFVGPKA